MFPLKKNKTKLESEDLPALLSALQGEDLFLINKAAKKIAAVDPRIKGGIHALRQVLKLPSIHISPEHKAKAAMQLVSLGPEAAEAVPELILALLDPHIPSREFILKALAAIGPAAESAVEPIDRVLGENLDFWVRMQAVETILKIGCLPEDSAGFLVSLTRSGADFTPLLKIAENDKRIAPALQKLFDDDFLLQRPGIKPGRLVIDNYQESAIEDIKTRAIQILARLAFTDESALKILGAVFKSADHESQIIGAGPLSKLNVEAEAILLKTFAQTSKVFLRHKETALTSCFYSTSQPLTVIRSIIKNLGETKEEIGRLAGIVLSRQDQPELLPLLLKELKENSGDAQAHAAMALGLKAAGGTKLTEEAIEELKKRLSSESVHVRMRAAEALCKAGFKMPEIAALYISFFKDPPVTLDSRILYHLAETAAEGLTKDFPFSDEIYFALLRGAASNDHWVYTKAIYAFKNIGPRAKNFIHTLRELADKEPYNSDRKYFLHETIKALRRQPKEKAEGLSAENSK